MMSLVDLHLARQLQEGVGYYSDTRVLRRHIDLFAELGLLDAGEAERWRRRFSASGSRIEARSPVTRQRALDHVHATGSPNVLATYGDLGVLSHEQLKAERERLRLEPGHDSRPASARDDHTGAFVRAIAAPSTRIGGLRVTTVELFEGAVAVNWHFDPAAAKGSDGARVRRLIASLWADGLDGPLIDLSGDTGRDHVPVVADGDTTGGGEWIGSHVFTPGVPPNSTRLDLTIAGRTLTVPLP